MQNQAFSIGKKIMELRNEHALSQIAFAERVGVSRRTVLSWECDKSSPRADMIKIICREFGVSIGYFYEEMPECVAAATVDDTLPQCRECEGEDVVVRRLRKGLIIFWSIVGTLTAILATALLIYLYALRENRPEVLYDYSVDWLEIAIAIAVILLVAGASVGVYYLVKFLRRKRRR